MKEPVGCCVEETRFSVLFPAYLEKYLQGIWDDVRTILQQYQLKGQLNLIEGSMSVSTTARTSDPISILYARDFCKLIARSVPVQMAKRVFDDDISYEILNIGGMCNNTQVFVKRRERLVGPGGGQTLKTLEILSDCYILVQGKTVSIIGPEAGLKKAKKIVIDCMRNIHPIYGLKRLMILRELEANEDMKGKDWSRFLPKYAKSHQKKSGKKRKAPLKENKPKSIFPPLPKPRKEDIAMETGEAFLHKKPRKQKQSDHSTRKTRPDDASK
uniref:KRR-R motif-containing protein 1 n=1 Tax=Paramoeba aestuarina TaxID=180227 RepID=A0A7S4KM68_9EUKA|mmetsp:Transcript_21584/g.33533  ORF Transcript_21584/g.33533 Transcript_21584/m.33533 type:complete len:271 (+) Transcript_21584:99-911(+)